MISNRAVALKRKQDAYADFDHALSSDDDENLDAGMAESIRKLKRARETTTSDISTRPDNPPAVKHPLRRQIDTTSTSASRPASRAEIPMPALVKGATFSGTSSRPMAQQQIPASTLSRSVTSAAPPTAIPKPIIKQKGVIKLVPPAERIFAGLHFFFFPNDDKSPGRAMRIAKALEFGSTWQQNFNEYVTHIVVDKMLSYDQLLRYLKLGRLPPGVMLVAEAYPSECISFRAVLDPKQRHFAVKGSPPEISPVVDEPRQPSDRSDRSLELKPAGRSVMARPTESPKTTDEAAASTQASLPPVRMSEGQTQRAGGGKITSTEEFDAAISRARELQHVPLEADEDESRLISAAGPETDDESSTPSKQDKQKSRSKYQAPLDKFQCMQKHTGERKGNPNASTIEILEQMADYYGQTGDEWRIRAYRKAIATLRNHPTKVTTRNEALALPQIGTRLAEKIEEIAVTSRLRRLENARAEPQDQVLQTFMKVYGAGIATASEWVTRGYKTLDELLRKADLTGNQRIGIEHFEDFNSRIPRVEVAQHGDVVRRSLQAIDPSFEVIIGGSYRRGSKDSGDIDCLITRPNTGAIHLRTIVLEQLVPQLSKAGFLVASLATTDRDDGSKWHGASCLPGSKVWRRIDLLLVPSDELGAALIYFTGNDIFNRSLRLLARTGGMRLNQRGLYKDVIRGNGRVKLTEGTLVEGKDEKRIFEVLGVPWRPPEHRIC
ncbi:DNA polymerase X family [Teratosphaeria destructans]|uniref:DNA polymerase lambda n=1 Tax=Teratosphaeria destructans TaxID=418781 RepID=A0A9W7SI17_9PEZI|nr:DNA polymerase X family [Teratosphaeria destructans]